MTAQNSTLFHEEQHLAPLFSYPVLLLPIFFLYGLVQQLFYHTPFGNKPLPDTTLIALSVIFGLLFPLWLLSLKIVTEVREQMLYIYFYLVMWRPREIPLKDIVHYEAQKFRPLRDCGGWGLRKIKGRMIYTTRGENGVHLELADGSKILLGSQRSSELVKAIDAARGKK